MYVLGTFYIRFLCTRATKVGKIVNPAVPSGGSAALTEFSLTTEFSRSFSPIFRNDPLGLLGRPG
jgi:hypothetical protein